MERVADTSSAGGGAVLPLEILRQPDDSTCGPTCLHAVYRYYGETGSLDDVIASVPRLPGENRGTLAVMLGTDALRRGYSVRLITFNLATFDPTWFPNVGGAGEAGVLASKLRAQREARGGSDAKLEVATDAYLEFLSLGGEIWFGDLTSSLISGLIRKGCPILMGVSATYLYRCAREFGPNDDYDDVRGSPSGHFVVVCGYDSSKRMVTVADPLAGNPGFESQRYVVPMARLVAAVLLGVLTYDANMLVVEPSAGVGR